MVFSGLRSPVEPPFELRPYRGPLRFYKGVHRRIANGSVVAGCMSAQDAIECAADTFDLRSRARISAVGHEQYAMDAPGFERVPQHQKLGLCVYRCSLRRCGQPCDTDLHGVRAIDPTLI